MRVGQGDLNRLVDVSLEDDGVVMFVARLGQAYHKEKWQDKGHWLHQFVQFLL